jgi:hypothetical protein
MVRIMRRCVDGAVIKSTDLISLSSTLLRRTVLQKYLSFGRSAMKASAMKAKKKKQKQKKTRRHDFSMELHSIQTPTVRVVCNRRFNKANKAHLDQHLRNVT